MTDGDLAGLWCMESADFPSHQNYLHFDVMRRRAIAFIIGKTNPIAYMPIPVWYRFEGPTQIATRIRCDGPWRRHECHLHGSTSVWVWNDGQPEQVWSRVRPNDHPEWLARRLERANSKMDEHERMSPPYPDEQQPQ